MRKYVFCYDSQDEFIDDAINDMVKIKSKLEAVGLASPETVAAIYNSMVNIDLFSDSNFSIAMLHNKSSNGIDY
ncbi:hypothetical protein KAP58_004456 [Salmonella enterica]|nr:hypothetical protein [Salmonella enterica]